MRILVLFDLPMQTSENIREYSRFRKYLIKSGFLMLQQSVYSKLALNTTVTNSIIQNIKKNKPKSGLVQLMAVTEKQFSKMEYIVGEKISEVLDSDERLIIL